MWLTWLFRSLQLLPVIVAGIEHIHGEAAGATKKQMAMDALGLAYGAASTLLPQEQQAIDAATVFASNTIDNVVSTFNQSGVFKTGKSVAAAPIAAVPLPAAFPAAAPSVNAADPLTPNRGD